MDISAAIMNGAEIACANDKERNQVLAILDNHGIKECLKGLGDPNGMIISLFADNSYMVDNEFASTNVVTGAEIIKNNLHIA